MKQLYSAIAALVIASGAAGAVAAAQQQSEPPAETQSYDDSKCGSWQNDAWVPNGNCPADTEHRRHDDISGTITTVKGHLVTIQQTARTLVINDQPALDHQQTGKVAVGRQVVAYGYWLDGTFYATAIY